MNWLNKIFKKRKKIWQNAEYFDEIWKDRISLMASYIEVNTSIIDLGCGMEWLQEMLPEGCTYYSSDYQKRSEKTIVCDFNKREFPNKNVDISFISGCLEYVEDFEWFISKVTKFSTKCIISYCTIEYFSNIEQRKERNWVNHLYEKDIINLFNKYDFELIEKNVTKSNNQIFIFNSK